MAASRPKTGAPHTTGAPRKGAVPAGAAPDRPLRARGQATRARLLDAGVWVFSRKGFHATRVDDIVTRAKTSHGTFYLYFPSKDALFDQLVADVAGEFRLLTDQLPRIDRTPEARAALEQWLVDFIEVYRRFGPLIRTWTEAERTTGDGTDTDGATGGVGDDVLGTVAAAFAARVRMRRRKDLDPAIASLALIAMVERVNYFLATGQLGDEPDQLAATLADIVLDALFGP
jgi:AcrR family transcriptional regulator